MRDLARSMIRISWAMPLLGMNQVANLVSPGDKSRPLDPITETFDAISEVAFQQMGPRLQELYEQGDRIQRQAVDTVFGVIESGLAQGQKSAS